MNSSQRNYCPTRRELLAVIAGLQHFRHYLVGASVILRTDHYSLKWLKTFKRPEASWPDGLKPWPNLITPWSIGLAGYILMLIAYPGPSVSNATTGLATYLALTKWRGRMLQPARGPSTCWKSPLN